MPWTVFDYAGVISASPPVGAGALLPENVRAARMLGIRAVRFTGVARLRADVARLAG
ncbi:hypothetical protein [Actinomadura coerulea]|uniref:hypothetical protein n=1 Tax=Actinomadura coerulea TaxID=46159 RepID=UPI00342588E9